MSIHSPDYAISFLPPSSTVHISLCDDKTCVRSSDSSSCVTSLYATSDTHHCIPQNAGLKCHLLSGTRSAHPDALEDIYDVYSSVSKLPHIAASVSLVAVAGEVAKYSEGGHGKEE